MFCIKCGGSIPTTARFCPACGNPVSEGGGQTASAQRPPQSGVAPEKRSANTRLIALIAGIAIVCAAIAAVLLHPRRQTPDAAGSATPAVAPSEAVAKPTSTIAGFDWSGLSPEELLAARAALDAAIAKEEQSSAKSPSSLQPASASTP